MERRENAERTPKALHRNARRNAQTAARKATLERRKNALRNACEGLLVARGWGIVAAAELAAWWVSDALQWAQRVMAKYGFDYLTSAWRAS